MAGTSPTCPCSRSFGPTTGSRSATTTGQLPLAPLGPDAVRELLDDLLGRDASMEGLAERLDEQAAPLAHHWEEAGEALPAARWHARASAWVGRSDPVRGPWHSQRVLLLSEELEDSAERRALRLDASSRVLSQGGWRVGLSAEESQSVFAEGCELARRSGDVDRAIALRVGYGATLGFSGDRVRCSRGPAWGLARSPRRESRRTKPSRVPGCRALAASSPRRSSLSPERCSPARMERLPSSRWSARWTGRKRSWRRPEEDPSSPRSTRSALAWRQCATTRTEPGERSSMRTRSTSRSAPRVMRRGWRASWQPARRDLPQADGAAGAHARPDGDLC